MPGHEHIASLGSIAMSPSIADRIAFWGRLHQRLAKLSNRVDANTHGKVLAAFALAFGNLSERWPTLCWPSVEARNASAGHSRLARLEHEDERT
jgi:hypothetical protein